MLRNFISISLSLYIFFSPCTFWTFLFSSHNLRRAPVDRSYYVMGSPGQNLVWLRTWPLVPLCVSGLHAVATAISAFHVPASFPHFKSPLHVSASCPLRIVRLRPMAFAISPLHESASYPHFISLQYVPLSFGRLDAVAVNDGWVLPKKRAPHWLNQSKRNQRKNTLHYWFIESNANT